MDYISDREQGKRSRIVEEIDRTVWQGILSLINTRIDDGSLGNGFPNNCTDGGVIGTNAENLWPRVKADIPKLQYAVSVKDNWGPIKYDKHWPPSSDCPPQTMAILDFIQFIAQYVGRPDKNYYHEFFKHHHLTFNRKKGLKSFVDDINGIFSRNGLSYKLTKQGVIERYIPSPIKQMINHGEVQTGDDDLDKLINQAIARFLSPKPEARQDALEKLWDAFERIKTVEPGKNKRATATALLQQIEHGSGQHFHQMIENEFKTLTDAGNKLRIRHSETNIEKIEANEQFDYLFVRMFSLLRFVLTRMEGIKQ